MADDRAIEAITNAARANRSRPSRALWIVTAIVGFVGSIAFVAIMISGGTPQKAPAAPERGLGFSTGLVLGVAIGIAIGFAIARRLLRDSSDQSGSPHSERNSP